MPKGWPVVCTLDRGQRCALSMIGRYRSQLSQGESHMRRAIPAAIFAVALVAAPLAAQQKPATPAAPPKVDAAKPVLLSGCLTGGPSSYTLSNVAATRVAHETADRPVGTS